jgi:hypothetical protein
MDTYVLIVVLKKEQKIIVEKSNKEKDYQFIKHLY